MTPQPKMSYYSLSPRDWLMKIAIHSVWTCSRWQMATFLTVLTVFYTPRPAAGQSWPQVSFATPIGGFHHPTHLAIAHDGSGRVFVAEQSGVIHIVKNGAILDTPFLDITGRPGTRGDQGLLS